MKLSSNGINLIKSFEGCKLEAYKCSGGKWTIGWGTTGSIDGIEIKQGMKITQTKADEVFIDKLKVYENTVNNYVTYKNLNQNMYDALVSFTYNCGTNAFKKSTLLELLNKGEILKAADQFDLWINAGGKPLEGLKRRRKAEKELFLKNINIKSTNEIDMDLLTAVNKLNKKGIINSVDTWSNINNFKLEYVTELINNMGGLNNLINKKIISNIELWENKKYNNKHVRSLIIKASNVL